MWASHKVPIRTILFPKFPPEPPLELATFKNNGTGLFGSKEAASLGEVRTISKMPDAMTISNGEIGDWAQMRGLEATQMGVRAVDGKIQPQQPGQVFIPTT